MSPHDHRDGAAAPSRRMTPSEIRHATLGRTGLGRRGYHGPDVDLLLKRIAGDVEGWMADNVALRAENNTLKAALREWKQAQHDQAAASQADPVALLRQVHECIQGLHDAGYRDRQLLRAQQQAKVEAELAVHDYRLRAGEQYSAAIEELERQVAWARVCFAAIADDVPLWESVADAFVGDGDLEWGPERFM